MINSVSRDWEPVAKTATDTYVALVYVPCTEFRYPKYEHIDHIPLKMYHL